MHTIHSDITAALLKSLYAQQLITESTYNDALQRLSSTLDNTPDFQYDLLQQDDNLGVEKYEYTQS